MLNGWGCGWCWGWGVGGRWGGKEAFCGKIEGGVCGDAEPIGSFWGGGISGWNGGITYEGRNGCICCGIPGGNWRTALGSVADGGRVALALGEEGCGCLSETGCGGGSRMTTMASDCEWGRGKVGAYDDDSGGGDDDDDDEGGTGPVTTSASVGMGI